MKISELPKELYELFMIEHKKQRTSIEEDSVNSSLTWCDTPQGQVFWSDVHYATEIKQLPAPYNIVHSTYEIF